MMHNKCNKCTHEGICKHQVATENYIEQAGKSNIFEERPINVIFRIECRFFKKKQPNFREPSYKL